MFKKFFKRTPPLKDALDDTILRLNQQKRKLELLNSKLKGRRSSLFNSCTTALEKKDADRAKIFANELIEVKKVHKTVTNGMLLLEQLIIRMETLKEIGSTFAQLQPTLEVVKDISGQLSEVMPEVSNELSQIGSSLDNAMICMNINMDQESILKIPQTIMNEDILEEASQFLKDKIEAKLPEPPREVGFARAIILGGDEEEEETINFEHAPKAVINKLTDYGIDKEDTLLEYLNSKDGNFDLQDCSASCKISETELAKVIDGLSRKGLIRIQTVEGAIPHERSK